MRPSNWCKNVSDFVTLLCGRYFCGDDDCIVLPLVGCASMSVGVLFNHGACPQSLTLACHLRPARGERRRRRVRREVAARRLICWRLCGSSACTTGGSIARCWRSPWLPTTYEGRALPSKQQETAGGTSMTPVKKTTWKPLPPLPLPLQPSLQSRRPAKMRLPPSLIDPSSNRAPACITHPPTLSSIPPQSSREACSNLSSFPYHRT